MTERMMEEMKSRSGTPNLELEWEKRTLCCDGSCIGVIGPDGRCKECGKPHGEGPTEEKPPSQYIEETVDTESGDEESGEEKLSESEQDIEWENRTLCSDESCIGVIGPDGHCKECGKPYE
ncbi:hypothetical protein ACFL9U_00655 [Thermodesulfobacteriota bacterium]